MAKPDVKFEPCEKHPEVCVPLRGRIFYLELCVSHEAEPETKAILSHIGDDVMSAVRLERMHHEFPSSHEDLWSWAWAYVYPSVWAHYNQVSMVVCVPRAVSWDCLVSKLSRGVHDRVGMHNVEYASPKDGEAGVDFLSRCVQRMESLVLELGRPTEIGTLEGLRDLIPER